MGRAVRVVEHNGEALALTVWAARLRLSLSALSRRLARGWPLALALTLPGLPRGKTARPRPPLPTPEGDADLTTRPPFGLLSVTAFAGRRGGGRLWECRCACPARTVTVVREQDLLRGFTGSCGCRRRGPRRREGVPPCPTT